MTNAFRKFLGFFWRQNTFSHLPKDASLDTICGEAGKLFAARVASNPQIDFDKEIWYLAEDAIRDGFTKLRGMTTRQVASAMGDSISRYIESQQKPPTPPRDRGYGSTW
jgi:hypothetical protein